MPENGGNPGNTGYTFTSEELNLISSNLELISGVLSWISANGSTFASMKATALAAGAVGTEANGNALLSQFENNLSFRSLWDVLKEKAANFKLWLTYVISSQIMLDSLINYVQQAGLVDH